MASKSTADGTPPDTGSETLPQKFRFWSTQPVAVGGDCKEGPLQLRTVASVRTSSLALPTEYEWCAVDIDCEKDLKSVYGMIVMILGIVVYNNHR